MFKKAITLIFVSLLLQACGAAHVRDVTSSEDIDNYTAAYIAEVKVISTESNPDATAINADMKRYVQTKLTDIINAKPYQTIPADDAKTKNALAFNVDISVTYGSRAARYFGGFGAGKGSVNSRLRVYDSVSKQSVFSSTAASELKFGAFGGNMQTVLKENIDKLLATYPQN